MMIVKLVNPVSSGMVMVFEVAGEVYFEPAGKLSLADQHDDLRQWEDMGHDARRYAAWPDAGEEGTLAMTRIFIPAEKPRGKPVMILTNHNAWLCNNEGRSVDRIHRYEP